VASGDEREGGVSGRADRVFPDSATGADIARSVPEWLGFFTRDEQPEVMTGNSDSGPAAIVLAEHRVIRINGPEHQAFLQGQLTQDVRRASPSVTLIAGWADAKGRLAWAGHLFARDDALCMLVPAALGDALVRRLRMFVLRAKVDIQATDLAILGLDAGMTLPALPPGWQPLRLAADASRRLLVGPQPEMAAVLSALGATPLTPGEWRRRNIRAGLAEITPATSGAFVPQMLNLDLVDGISFAKGCYTGQEIVARTRYLGRIKRRMLRFAANGTAPAAGEPVHAERGVVGQIVLAAATETGAEILAVISLDDLPGPLYLDETGTRPVQKLPLPYPIPELDR
jgi:hypothetical protein